MEIRSLICTTLCLLVQYVCTFYNKHSTHKTFFFAYRKPFKKLSRSKTKCKYYRSNIVISTSVFNTIYRDGTFSRQGIYRYLCFNGDASIKLKSNYLTAGAASKFTFVLLSEKSHKFSRTDNFNCNKSSLNSHWKCLPNVWATSKPWQ